MTTPQKISTAFWSSAVLLAFGLILQNHPLPVALTVFGGCGLAFSVGWFFLHMHDR